MNSKAILSFLEQLTQNNNKEWFQENKATYEKLRQEFIDFINKLIPAIAEFDNNIKHISAKDCLFRIYRDVRFSKDKTPYKNNFGAYIAANGKNSRSAGYYFHIEPAGSMLAGGIYLPPPDVLKLVRSEIYYNMVAYKKIINDKLFLKQFGSVEGEKLVHAPKDFPKDFADIDILKYKSYTIIHKLSNIQVLSTNLFEETINIFKAMHPINSFFNKALEKCLN
ncbi:MAG: hypothetical protein AUJ97_01080 [Bacteroidetes bacterium CG2_30_32_10]|nr:MAG: hypothetical protein AUJ97_01080 [Bacteroidetes bacterium CG2_30_32_10]